MTLSVTVTLARRSGEKVVYIRHEFPSADAPFFVPGSEGAQIHASMAPAEGEPVIVKNQINASLDTELKQVFDADGIEEVTVVGAMSHMCINAATRAAPGLGCRTVVVHDACATRDLEFNGEVVPAVQVHSACMSALAFGYAKVMTTRECLATSAERVRVLAANLFASLGIGEAIDGLLAGQTATAATQPTPAGFWRYGEARSSCPGTLVGCCPNARRW